MILKRGPKRPVLYVPLVAWVLSGCGGADFGGSNRSNGFDQGLGSGFGSPGGFGSSGFGPQSSNPRPVKGQGVFPKQEFRFEITGLQGNPFDYTQNDVRVSIRTPDGRLARIPAFFDGGTTWRARYTPEAIGRHSVSQVTVNGKQAEAEMIENREFDVSGSPKPGFIRIDPKDATRFAHDTGASFYPIGVNAAWGEVKEVIEKVGGAGGNWVRVWMCHWGGTNLSWPESGKIEAGSFSLEAARKVDAIVEAAEKAGVRIQLVLQHHGQFSTKTNPNWNDNPLNNKNGGPLETPDEFFSNPKAMAQTRALYRYIVARWGYSPYIMAWELFNEVEWTDALAHQHEDEVAAWHAAMSEFLRKEDPNRHLVTSSSKPELARVFKAMDYYQPHTYPADVLAAVQHPMTGKSAKPTFYGEIGGGPRESAAETLHAALWGSIMSPSAGTAQLWSWEQMLKENLFSKLEAVASFVRQSGKVAKKGALVNGFAVTTKERGVAAFGPAGDWGKSAKTDFIVDEDGEVEGLAGLSAYLQGDAHRDMTPRMSFEATFREAGSVSVLIDRISSGGGRLRVLVDGAVSAEKSFEAANRDRDVSEAVNLRVSAGKHVIRIENPGKDWVYISRIELAPVGPALAAYGQSGPDFGWAWLVRRGRREEAVVGQLRVAGLKSGSYKATWWDTEAGKVLSEASAATTGSQPLALETPPVRRDIAVWIAPSGEKVAKR